MPPIEVTMPAATQRPNTGSSMAALRPGHGEQEDADCRGEISAALEARDAAEAFVVV
jgi:hypothetical protein